MNKYLKFRGRSFGNRINMLPESYLQAIQLLKQQKLRLKEERHREVTLQNVMDIAEQEGISGLSDRDFQWLLEEVNRSDLDRWTNCVLGQFIPPGMTETGRLPRHEHHVPERTRFLQGHVHESETEKRVLMERRTAAAVLDDVKLFHNGLMLAPGEKFVGKPGDLVVGVDLASDAKFVGRIVSTNGGDLMIEEVKSRLTEGALEYGSYLDLLRERLCAAFQIPQSHLFPHDKEGEKVDHQYLSKEYNDLNKSVEEECREESGDDVRARNLATSRVLKLAMWAVRSKAKASKPEDWVVKALAFVSHYTFIPFGPPLTTGGAYFRADPELGGRGQPLSLRRQRIADVTEEFAARHWYSEWQQPVRAAIAKVGVAVANQFLYNPEVDRISPELYARYILPGAIMNCEAITAGMSEEETRRCLTIEDGELKRGLMLDERDPFKPDYEVDWDTDKEDVLLPCAVDTCPYARPTFAGKIECPILKTVRSPGQFCAKGFERNLSLQSLEEHGMEETSHPKHDGIEAVFVCPKCGNDYRVKIRRTVMTRVFTLYHMCISKDSKHVDIGNRCTGEPGGSGSFHEFYCCACKHSWPIPEWLKGEGFKIGNK